MSFTATTLKVLDNINANSERAHEAALIRTAAPLHVPSSYWRAGFQPGDSAYASPPIVANQIQPS